MIDIKLVTLSKAQERYLKSRPDASYVLWNGVIRLKEDLYRGANNVVSGYGSVLEAPLATPDLVEALRKIRARRSPFAFSPIPRLPRRAEVFRAPRFIKESKRYWTAFVFNRRLVCVGCQCHTLDWWLKNYKEMGRRYGMPTRSIEAFGRFFRRANKAMKKGKLR